jgi:hypothetical protein
MSFNIFNTNAFNASGSNTQKVEYAIKEFIEGRGERRELLEEISKLTGLSISEVDSSFDTLRYRGAFTTDELSRSRFANHWLVNKTDDDFEIYDSLADNYNVYIQVLMDMGLSSGVDSITYKTQTEMFRDVKKFFEDNHGNPTRSEANNLYNKLKDQGLIEDLDGGGFKVNIASDYSSDTPLETVNVQTKGRLRYYFYLIMEYTVEKFNDAAGENLYKYTFLNIGITNDLRKRYRNQGFELLKLYEGDFPTVKLIEDQIKLPYSNRARYNRFNMVTKEQFDDQNVILDIINEVNRLANQHNLIDITANFNVAKPNAMLPPGAVRV